MAVARALLAVIFGSLKLFLPESGPAVYIESVLINARKRSISAVI